MVGSKRDKCLDSQALKHRKDGPWSGGVGVALCVRIFEIRFRGFKSLLELLFNIGIGIEGIDEAIVSHNILMGGKFWGFPQRKELWER